MPITFTDTAIKVPIGYELILHACNAALLRAAVGKGRSRHAEYDNQPLSDQQIYRFSQGWRLDQIQKKAAEIPRLKSRDRANEVLDIIVLAAVEWAKLEGLK